jgi:hypothetical protein
MLNSASCRAPVAKTTVDQKIVVPSPSTTLGIGFGPDLNLVVPRTPG